MVLVHPLVLFHRVGLVVQDCPPCLVILPVLSHLLHPQGLVDPENRVHLVDPRGQVHPNKHKHHIDNVNRFAPQLSEILLVEIIIMSTK